MIDIDIVICTHSPRKTIIARIISAIANQDYSGNFRVLLVDSASQVPLTKEIFSILEEKGIHCSLHRMEQPGLLVARLAASSLTSAPLILFVDDDNELDPDYLSVGHAFADNHPEVGAFSGKLLLPSDIAVPAWIRPLLSSMGLKDEGEGVIINSTQDWGPHDPPGAGLWVRRELLISYVKLCAAHPDSLLLGAGQAGYCDDAVLVKQNNGYKNAYVPSLKLTHHLKPTRFSFLNACRSARGYGVSHVIYENIFNLPHTGRGIMPIKRTCIEFIAGRKIGLRYAFTRALYRWSYEMARKKHG